MSQSIEIVGVGASHNYSYMYICELRVILFEDLDNEISEFSIVLEVLLKGIKLKIDFFDYL